jgi:hypothetical protein
LYPFIILRPQSHIFFVVDEPVVQWQAPKGGTRHPEKAVPRWLLSKKYFVTSSVAKNPDPKAGGHLSLVDKYM